MSAQSQAQIGAIFDQLLALRESVNRLQQMEDERVGTLRGHQTVDVDGAFLFPIGFSEASRQHRQYGGGFGHHCGSHRRCTKVLTHPFSVTVAHP